MNSVETAERMLSAAALYVSMHRNGIAKLCSPRAKPGLLSSRDILFKQITAVRNTVVDPHLRSDDSILLSGVTICREYFRYMHALISHEWTKNLEALSTEPPETHRLYQVATQDGDQIERVLQSLADKTAESRLRIDNFIVRFLVARTLFENSSIVTGKQIGRAHV